MKVDRSRFLLLAAALSANACTIVNNTNADAGAPDTGTSSGDTGADTTVDTSMDETATDSALAETSTDSAADSAETLCTDEGMAVTPCSGTTAGGCSLDALTQCTSFPQYFKPKVAQAAVDCLAALPTCEGTVSDPAVWDCAYSALEGACPDSDVDTFCAGIIAICSDPEAGADAGTDLADCKKYASGLNLDGRNRLQALVTAEGGCTVPLVEQFPNL